MPFRDRKDHGKPPEPRLDGLPVEILLRVAQHVDKRDAPGLATVCKFLQDPAESIIWETVSLALGASWCQAWIGGVNSRAELKLGPVEMTAMRSDERLAETPVNAQSEWPAHCAKMERRVKEIEGAFSSRPQRAKHVRRLVLEPTNRVWDRIMDQVWPNIEHLELDLFGITGGGQQEAAKLVKGLCDNLRRMDPSQRLRLLELKLSGDRSEDLITDLLRLAPNLTDLYLRQTPEDMPAIEKIVQYKWSGIAVHFLRRIDWSRQHDQLEPLIDHLLKRAPFLEEFRLKDDVWEQDEFTTIAKSLAKVQTLRRLTWNSVEITEPFDGLSGGSFEHLEELVVPDDLGHDANMVLENVDIPSLPALRAILVPALSSGPSIEVSSPREAPDGHIHPQILDGIRSAPVLSYVQFGGAHQERAEPDVTSWCDKHLDGIVIRTYGDSSDQLVHLRRLAFDSVHRPHSCARELEYPGVDEERNFQGHRCSGILDDCSQHRWEDSTDYQGLPVPPAVLCDFYGSLGETPNWAQPARLPMPAEGLRILQDWRSSQGQPWHFGRNFQPLRIAHSILRTTVEDLRRENEFHQYMAERGTPLNSSFFQGELFGEGPDGGYEEELWFEDDSYYGEDIASDFYNDIGEEDDWEDDGAYESHF